MNKKKSLGKGLAALLDNKENDQKPEETYIFEMEINKIIPNQKQPRSFFDEEKIQELASSIDQQGLIEPIVVSPSGNNYEIIAGERRYRAFKLLKKKSIPVYIKNCPKDKFLELALIENIQRENLSPIEEARALSILLETQNITHEDLGKKLGKSRIYITNSIRLLKLPEKILDLLHNKTITPGQVRPLIGMPEKNILEIIDNIISQKLSSRDVESLVKTSEHQSKVNVSRETNIKKNHNNPDLKKIETQLIHFFESKVKIKGSQNKGKIEIEYFSLDELNNLIKKIL
ncbi:MAG: hypothetical protein A2096_00600 [Spirochaetes bacterium GWF1_41_5]|nr:MAG: hypothetical protein A2096_00600 [Spirochaetes bacterium GWF1_41_5]